MLVACVLLSNTALAKTGEFKEFGGYLPPVTDSQTGEQCFGGLDGAGLQLCSEPWTQLKSTGTDPFVVDVWHCPARATTCYSTKEGGCGCEGGLPEGWELPRSAISTYQWPIVRVIDGDTVEVDADQDMPPELAKLRLRLRGVDTPEKGGRAKCASERSAGLAATEFTRRAIVRAHDILIRNLQWGKWGGRVIGDLMLDGRPLSQTLIEAGHGRPYDGGRRKSWCNE